MKTQIKNDHTIKSNTKHGYRVYMTKIHGKKKKQSTNHFFEAADDKKVNNKLATYFRMTKDGDMVCDWSYKVFKY